MTNPVTIVTTGQNPVTSVTTGQNPVTAVTTGENPVTIVTTGENPMTFIGGLTLFTADMRAGISTSASWTFDRGVDDLATVTDQEGLVKETVDDVELRSFGARRVENLATGLVTETITVVSGNEYQITIAGANGATAICANAFTGTLTADGANRISWPSGTPKTSGSTSLVITVSGTLTELLVEDVTGQANQNPSEYVSVGILSTPWHGANIDGVKYFAYEHNNTVNGSGVVSEATGTAIPDADLLGTMVEKLAENTVPYSDDFTQVQWIKINSVISAGAISPLGSAAPVVTDNSSGGNKICGIQEAGFTVASGTSVFSAFIKADQLSIISLQSDAYDAGGNGQTWFDLSTGTIGVTSANHTPGIEDFGNGWYRCSIAFTTTVDLTGSVIIKLAEIDGGGLAAMDGTSSVLVAGAQVEIGDYPTTYVPTTGSARTRGEEELKFLDIFPTANFCMVMEFTLLQDAADIGTVIVCETDDSGTDDILIRIVTSWSYTANGGGAVINLLPSDFTAGTYKVAIQAVQNGADVDYLAVLDGVTKLDSTEATQTLAHSDTEDILIGSDNASGNQTQILVEQLDLYDVSTTPKTEAELQALTA